MAARMNAQERPNPFRALWSMGYEAVLPVVPPDVKLHPDSHLSRRMNKGEADPRGKAPGKIWRDDLWGGFKYWTTYKADELDLQRWNAMGASVGLRMGDGGLAAIDADALTPEYAELITERVRQRFGVLPTRVGRHPKTLWLLRSDPELSASSFKFGPERQDKFEILAGVGKKQCVVHGIHPFTREPYRWTQKLVPLCELPYFPASELEALIAELRAALPNSSAVVVGAAGTTLVDQESLKGDLDTVRCAVQATPNTNAHFQSREAYRDMGYAIKASLADYPAEALDLWLDWCARWEGGENDPVTVTGDWNRMNPSFRRGKTWLYKIAEEASAGGPAPFSRWTPYLETPDLRSVEQQKADAAAKAEAERLFKEDTPEPAGPAIRAEPFRWIDPKLIPPRRTLYGGHYTRKFLSVTVAPSKVGKTALSIVEALAMASGRPLLGIQPAGCFRVWLWNGEDPLEETQRRVTAAMLHYGITPEDLGGRLFIGSGRSMPIMLAKQERSGAVIADPVVEGVVAALRAAQIDVFIVDPFVSSHQVPENDNNAIDLVAKKWAQIADMVNCSIELIHHVRKLNGSETTVEDGRGASALIAASRSIRALARMSNSAENQARYGDAWRRLFRFADESSNLFLPPRDDEKWFELTSVNLGNGEGDVADAFMNGDSIGVVRTFDKVGCDAQHAAQSAPGYEQDVLRAIREGEWQEGYQAKTGWVGHAVASAYRLQISDPGDREKVKAIVRDLIQKGTIRTVRKQNKNDKWRSFLEVVKQDSGLFD